MVGEDSSVLVGEDSWVIVGKYSSVMVREDEDSSIMISEDEDEDESIMIGEDEDSSVMVGEDKNLEYDINEPHDIEKYENNYLPLIVRLRASLTQTASHDIGVLVPQLPENERYRESLLYLTLTSDDRSIIVVLQQSNLYVRGYSRDGGNTYWAFSDSIPMIPRSRSLKFDGNYQHLEGLAHVRRETLTLGFPVLEDAISYLANTEDPHRQQQAAAKRLLVLCVMIAEAARIKLISDHIYKFWWTPKAMDRHTILSLVNSWGTLSCAVQNSGPNVPLPTASPLLPDVPSPNDTEVYNVRQAVTSLGLLIYSRSTAPRLELAEEYPKSYARTLVCIEYIKINNIDGEDPGDLYGTVFVTDCWGQSTVYDRSRADSESIVPGQYATLTGPTAAISGADAFTISANLMDRDRDPSLDNHIAQGVIIWDPRFQDLHYNKTVEEIIWGPYGNVTVGYSVITYSLNATIKVVMINGDGENPADIYGTIDANISLKESSQIVSLFDKSSSERIHVHPGDSIPLNRSVIPAPVNSNLVINAKLWDHDTFSSDAEIAWGYVEIMPIATTDPAKPMKITGKYGEVEVYVVFD